MAYPEYSVVIATKGRSSMLNDTISDLKAQTIAPKTIIIVDASEEVEKFHTNNGIIHTQVSYSSSAKQRNTGAELVDTELICFLDDDVRLPKAHFEKLLISWEIAPEIVGMSARIQGLIHKPPRWPLRSYYSFQAGYKHPDFGGKVFGPAINCVPCYNTTIPLIDAEWLNSTCLLMRTSAFRKERFPSFEGYSWGEDLHLSLRLAKHGKLYFENTSEYVHIESPTAEKRDHLKMGFMQAHHRYRIGRECMQKSHRWLINRIFLHSLFLLTALSRSNPKIALAFTQGALKALTELRSHND